MQVRACAGLLLSGGIGIGSGGAPPAASCRKVDSAVSNLRLWIATRPSARPRPTTSSAGEGQQQRTAAPKPAKVCTSLREEKFQSCMRPSSAQTKTYNAGSS